MGPSAITLIMQSWVCISMIIIILTTESNIHSHIEAFDIIDDLIQNYRKTQSKVYLCPTTVSIKTKCCHVVLDIHDERCPKCNNFVLGSDLERYERAKLRWINIYGNKR